MWICYELIQDKQSRKQKELTRMGARTKKGKKFASSQLNEMLKKPFYCGRMETKYGVVEHQYERLATPEIFRRVQEIIEGYHHKPYKTDTRSFILKGMITCANCGCVVTPELKKKKYIYYSCTNAKKTCQRVYVRENELVKPLMEYFERIALSGEQIETVVQHLREIHQSESVFHHESLKALRTEQDKIQRRISQVYDDKLDGIVDEKMYLEKVREYKIRQAEILDE